MGKSERKDFDIDHSDYHVIGTMAKALFALFNIVAVLVGLNALIAMLTESYERVKVSKEPFL